MGRRRGVRAGRASGGRAPGRRPPRAVHRHLDTVFEPDSPFQKFERIDVTSARGPGMLDMKGGDVIIVQALRALDAAGVLKA